VTLTENFAHDKIPKLLLCLVSTLSLLHRWLQSWLFWSRSFGSRYIE